MKFVSTLKSIALTILSFAALGTTISQATEAKFDWEFFPFDNAFDESYSADQQVALLKKLGYDGICSRPKNTTPELFAALEKYGLKMQASYMVLPVIKDNPAVPESIINHLKDLKGHDTTIWLSFTVKNASESDAVALLQNVHAHCAENGLELVLYPHVNFYTDTVAKCVRLREQAQRPDIGLSFTLCHFLKQNDHRTLEDTVRSIAPHLKLVQISGANETSNNPESWDDFIKPLGQGNFQFERLIKVLEEIDFQGGVNLQCYKLPQPARKHLKASMKAWKQFTQ